MKNYEVVTYPNPLLRENSEEIISFDNTLREFGKLLLEAMIEQDGVGLAAIQIGRPLCVIALRNGDGGEIFVNPKILWMSKNKEKDIEGCISVPKVFGEVYRSTKIKIRAQDLFGKLKKFEAQGFYARVFQHEVDHTNGILFIDKTEKILEAPKNFILPM